MDSRFLRTKVLLTLEQESYGLSRSNENETQLLAWKRLTEIWLFIRWNDILHHMLVPEVNDMSGVDQTSNIPFPCLKSWDVTARHKFFLTGVLAVKRLMNRNSCYNDSVLAPLRLDPTP